MKKLKDETDLRAPQQGAFPFRQPGKIPPLNGDPSFGGDVDARGKMQQRRFPAPASPDDGDFRPVRELERDIPEGESVAAAERLEDLRNTFKRNDGFHPL